LGGVLPLPAAPAVIKGWQVPVHVLLLNRCAVSLPFLLLASYLIPAWSGKGWGLQVNRSPYAGYLITNQVFLPLIKPDASGSVKILRYFY